MNQLDKATKQIEDGFDELGRAMDAAFKQQAGVGVKVPSGSRLVKRVGYRIPDNFVGIQLVKIHERPWWKFWLPKKMYLYTVIVEK